MRSPLLDLPDAVAGSGIDAPVAAHYGSMTSEQRTLLNGDGFVDLSHRDVFEVTGPDRLTWLHSLTTQAFEGVQPGESTSALILDPNGRVEHAFVGVDDGETFRAHTEPGAGQAVVDFLTKMIFMTRVEVALTTEQYAVCWRPKGFDDESAVWGGPVDFVPREELETYAKASGPAVGLWAYEAFRIARGEARHGIDTDERTIPNEAGWIGPAVHLEKGCYRGQETVARVHTLGRPPRRLTLLHLDGSENRLPEPGTPIKAGEKQIGVVGSSARHHELGPIGLALIKRNVATDAQLDIDGLAAKQEIVVDPEVGLHVRPLR